MTIGIYYIKNLENDKSYIGSSKNIEKRFKQHLNSLRNGKHINVHLQRSYDLHGEDKFEFGILEETSELFIREEFYIKQIDVSDLYNLGSVGGGDNLTNHPNKEDIIFRMRQTIVEKYKNASLEDKIKLSNRMTGCSNPNYGNQWTKIQRLAASTRCVDRYNDSPEVKYKISETLKNNWKCMTNEEKMKVSPTIRKIKIGDTVYFGMNHAAAETGINAYTIRYRAKSPKFEEYSFVD